MIVLLAMTAIGAILGIRFSVFVLVPAIAVASLGSLAIGVGQGTGIWSSLVAAYFLISGLQIGYIAGSVRFGAGMARARNHQSDIVTVAQRH